MRVLEGIRVIEWGAHFVGPAAAASLGDMGAEVIKIEDIAHGDPTRGYKKIGGAIPVVDQHGHSYYFEVYNRHKKSIALDLKKEQGIEVIRRLVKKSDVFLTNYRRKAALKLGLDYESLSRCNPRLIYATASGYGLEGPDANEPGFDLAGQARGGILMAMKRAEDEPSGIEGMGDQIGSIITVEGILAALLARERFGMGQEVSTSIVGSVIWLQHLNITLTLLTGEEWKSRNRRIPANPLLNFYRASDGKWLVLGMGATSDVYWPVLCSAMGTQQLEKDPRFVNMDVRARNSEALVKIFDEIFASRTRGEWLRALKERNVVVQPVSLPSEVIEDDQVKANKYVVDYVHPNLGKVKLVGSPLAFSQTPSCVGAPAPAHGQHTEEVLIDVCGYTWDDISRFKAQQVII